jgi:hypothetical protein
MWWESDWQLISINAQHCQNTPCLVTIGIFYPNFLRCIPIQSTSVQLSADAAMEVPVPVQDTCAGTGTVTGHLCRDKQTSIRCHHCNFYLFNFNFFFVWGRGFLVKDGFLSLEGRKGHELRIFKESTAIKFVHIPPLFRRKNSVFT